LLRCRTVRNLLAWRAGQGRAAVAKGGEVPAIVWRFPARNRIAPPPVRLWYGRPTSDAGTAGTADRFEGSDIRTIHGSRPMTQMPCSRGRAANATRTWAFEVLGPMPGASLHALEDLGLTDAELARYLRVSVADLLLMRQSLTRRDPARPHRGGTLPQGAAGSVTGWS
jgi:hypothetical protein